MPESIDFSCNARDCVHIKAWECQHECPEIIVHVGAEGGYAAEASCMSYRPDPRKVRIDPLFYGPINKNCQELDEFNLDVARGN